MKLDGPDRGVVAAMGLAVALRIPLLRGDFFRRYDDGILIVDNEIIAHPSWAGLAKVLFTNFRGEGQNGMHLANFLSMAGFGDNYLAFALTNLLWLAATVYLVYRLAGVFLTDRWLQAGTALVFACHNLVTDNVAWISARGHLLALPFALAAVWAWSRASDPSTEPTARDRFWPLMLVGFACAAVATWMKIFYVSVFVVLGLHDVIRGRVRSRTMVAWILLLIGIGVNLSRSPVAGGLTSNLQGPADSTLPGRVVLVAEHLQAVIVPQSTAIAIQHTVPVGWWDLQTQGLTMGVLPPALALVGLVALVASATWFSLRYAKWQVVFAVLSAVVVLLPSLTWRPVQPGLAFEFRYAMLCAIFLVIGGAVVIETCLPVARKARLRAWRGVAGVVLLYTLLHAGHTVEQSWLLGHRAQYWRACAERFPVTAICHDIAARMVRKNPQRRIQAFETEAASVTQSGLLRHIGVETELARLYAELGDAERELMYLRQSLVRDRLRGDRRKAVERRIQELRRASTPPRRAEPRRSDRQRLEERPELTGPSEHPE